MIEYIGKIPDVVWAALLASVLTLAGVIFSNWNSRRQTRSQLEHDALQRDREREMHLRQNIYIRALEAITREQHILIRLCDLNLSDKEINAGFIDDSATLAKIQVVGTNETVQAIVAFQQELGAAYLELTLDRIPLITRKNRIELLTELIGQRQAEQDRLVSLMRQLNIEGNVDERIWKVVRDNFEFEKQQLHKYSDERQELEAKQNQEYPQFIRQCFRKYLEVSKLVPPAVFAAREELELPFDRKRFLTTFNNSLQRGMDVFQEFIEKASKFTKS